MSVPHPQLTRSTWVALAMTLIAVALVLYAWRLPPFRTATERTENAYVRGSVTVIAPKVDGYVTDVRVLDFAPVKAGQVLVQLDERNYEQKVAQAGALLASQEAALLNSDQTRRVREAGILSARAQMAAADAQIANAEAQYARAKADHDRSGSLVEEGSVSRREFEQSQATLRQADAARRQADASMKLAHATKAAADEDLRSVSVNRRALEAGVANARAALALAQIDLDNTRIRAPRDGQVGEVGVKLGQYVSPGTQLLALVPTDVWIVANFKERQTAHMASGQQALMRVDALADAELKGRIERIAPATGSEFSVIRPDNATGNFTKIPQRLAVRLRVDAGQALAAMLRPGMSVVVDVDTSSNHP